MVLNGNEIGGGSIRIHRPEMQSAVFELLGIGADEAQAKFGFLLEALKFGAPPHGGIAFGIDRIAALMAGTESIRDVIAFPKTTSAQDLMTDAPSPVADVQLKELHVKVAVERKPADALLAPPPAGRGRSGRGCFCSMLQSEPRPNPPTATGASPFFGEAGRSSSSRKVQRFRAEWTDCGVSSLQRHPEG